MAVIFIECTHCRAEIDTRIEVDAATFAQLPDIESEMICPACGTTGFWDKSRARLHDANSPKAA